MKRFAKGALPVFAGALLLCLYSFVHGLIAGHPATTLSMVFSTVAGGVLGLAAALIHRRTAGIQAKLDMARSELEQRVHTRTVELLAQSRRLASEIGERRKAERAFEKSEKRLKLALEAATDALVEWDLTTGHIYWSPRFFTMLGYEPGEMPPTYGTWQGLLHPEDRRTVTENIDRVIEGHQDVFELEFRLRTRDGGYRWVWTRARSVGRGPDNKPELLIGTQVDITPRKEARQALAESEAKFRGLVELATDGIAIIQNEKLVYVNPHLASLMGYEPQEVIGTNFLQYVSPRTRVDAYERYDSIVRGKAVHPLFEHQLIRKDGSLVDVEVSAGPSVYQGRKADFVFMRDITDRRQAREKLAESEARYRGIFDAANDSLLLFDLAGNVVDANPRACEMYGYTLDELVGIPGRNLVHDECRHLFDNFLLRAGQGDRFFWESVDLTKNGQPVFVEGKGSRFDYQGTPRLLAVLRDVTERRMKEDKLRASEELFSRVFFLSPVSIAITTIEDGRIVMVNNAFASLVGIAREKIIGELSERFWGRGGSRGAFVAQLLDRKRIESVEVKVKRVDGELRDCIYSAEIVEFGGEPHIITMGIDITERKQGEERIRAALEEKDVLLREVHHRVKNNFLVIISLLSLQAQYSTDRSIEDILYEVQERIRSMALVHQRLYQSESLAKIDFAGYVEEMCHSLLTSFGNPGSRVRVDIEGGGVLLGVDEAVPAGMIVNELVTNSLKYAFPDDAEGRVVVRLENEDGRMAISVQDNGVGLPSEVEVASSRSFGLMLVRLLTEQLRGTLELASGDGAGFTVRFSLRDKARKPRSDEAPAA